MSFVSWYNVARHDPGRNAGAHPLLKLNNLYVLRRRAVDCDAEGLFPAVAPHLQRHRGMGLMIAQQGKELIAVGDTVAAQLRDDIAGTYARLFRRAAGQHNLLSVFEKNHAPQKPACQLGSVRLTQEKLYQGEPLFLQTRPPQQGPLPNALAKMAACPHALKEMALVSNGLMTGCDKISAAHLRQTSLPGVQKGAGVFVLSEAEKKALTLTTHEQQKLKPFFKNSDIFPYAAATRPSGWLIDFFYPNDRELDFSLYPHLRAHLARFAPLLLARKQNNNGIDKLLARGVYWFGSVRRRMNFEADKIAVPQRAARNTFGFAPGPWYASSDVYFISQPQHGLSLWYLLGLFNSAPYFAWLFYQGKRKGRLLELYSAPLNALPVPLPKPKMQRQVETLAQEMYRLKSQNPQADISALQARADELVGQIFQFTPAEQQAVRDFSYLSAQTGQPNNPF